MFSLCVWVDSGKEGRRGIVVIVSACSAKFGFTSISIVSLLPFPLSPIHSVERRTKVARLTITMAVAVPSTKMRTQNITLLPSY